MMTPPKKELSIWLKRAILALGFSIALGLFLLPLILLASGKQKEIPQLPKVFLPVVKNVESNIYISSLPPEERLKEIRNAIEKKGARWEADLTSVAMLSLEEKRKLLSGVIKKPETYTEGIYTPKISETPSSFDWRNKDGTDWVTPIRDQAKCGSCWAFAAVGSIEARANIYFNNSDLDLDLAEQHLVSDCCTNCGDCGGGYPDKAVEYARDYGLVDEECFPYTAKDSSCNLCGGWEDRLIKIIDYSWVEDATTDAYKSALIEYGPLTVVLRAPDDFLYYESGIYESIDNPDDYGWANHAVVLVGYNDAGEYWIIKNSWGTNWGEEGYGTVAYGNLEKYDYAIAVEAIESIIRITIRTDKDAYDPTETIFVTGSVEKEKELIEASLNIKFLGPEGDLIDEKSTTSYGGTFSTDFAVPSGAEPGLYSIIVEASYGDEFGIKTKKVKVGSLVIDLSETETVIPYETTHVIKGHVYYKDGGAVENADTNAYIKKDGVIVKTLTTTSNSQGYFSMSWFPSDYGKYDIKVIARDPVTPKIGREDIELTVNPPAPGTLRVILRDAEGIYIYDWSCPYSPSEEWYDITTIIYDENNEEVERNIYSKCEEAYDLAPGNYRVVVSGKTKSWQKSPALIDQNITISESEIIEMNLTHLAKLKILLKDAQENYIYDWSCPYSPSEEWYDITTIIYDANSEEVIRDTNSGCEGAFYLMEGDYRVVVSGKTKSWQKSYALIDQNISIAREEVKDVDLTHLGKLKITLKDAQENYIYDWSCPYSPSEEWYDVTTIIYDANSEEVIRDTNSGCEGAFYLMEGDYNLCITAKKNSGDISITHCYDISVSSSVFCSATVIVDTGEFSYDCFCSDLTPFGSCSATQPLFCDNGNLVDKCSLCGCPLGYVCQPDESCLSCGPPPSTNKFRVEGRKLLLNDEEFKIKGVGYQPYPIGYASGMGFDIFAHPEIYNRDFNLLRGMNANSIRTWAKVTKTEFLDAAYNDGEDPIYVIMGYWLDSASNDYSDPATRESIIADFNSYVMQFKDHPAVMMWAIGNEDAMVYTGDIADFYSLANEIGEAAYQIEAPSYHPVTIVNWKLENIGDESKGAADWQLPYISAWGTNIFPGETLTPSFEEYAPKSEKPIWVSEYGIDAWDNVNGREYQETQAEWDIGLWNDINVSDVCIGGAVMAYTDEWWKDWTGNISVHDYGGYATDSHPDGYGNEEWWGICSVTDTTGFVDIVTPRLAYYAFANAFAGREKACDASSDCGESYWTDEYCENNDVYGLHVTNTCNYPSQIYSYCSEDRSYELKEECDYKCENGSCIENQPPTIDSYYPSTDPTIDEGQQQEFWIVTSDPYDDPLTTTWLLDGVVVDNDNSYTYVSDYDSAGDYNVTVIVSDGELDARHYWLLIVDDVSIECYNDTECDDLNAYTQDTCNNPGTPESYCSHETIACINASDCGTNGYIGEKFCSGDNVMQTHRTHACNNSGTPSASCSYTDEDVLIQECEYGCSNGTCNQAPGQIFYEPFESLQTIDENKGQIQDAEVKFVSGVFGNAVSLELGSYVNYPTAGNVEAEKGTMEFWLKTTDYNEAESVSHGLMSIYGDSSTLFSFIRYGKGTIGAWVEEGVGGFEQKAIYTGVNRDLWHHIAIVWNCGNDGYYNIYLDGEEGHTRNGDGLCEPLGTLSEFFEIGKSAWYDESFAIFDELNVYNYAKTEDEIIADFLRGYYSLFADVSVHHWAYEEIKACYEEGIVRGYGDGYYQPEGVVNRAQMAVFIARAIAQGDENVPEGPEEPNFPDVPKDFWAYKYIEYLKEQGVVGGYDDDLYHPEYEVDRAQMAAFISRAIAEGEENIPEGPEEPNFPDVPKDFWAYKYIEYLKERGIVSGYDDNLYHPEFEVDRGQMAVFIYRAFLD